MSPHRILIVPTNPRVPPHVLAETILDVLRRPSGGTSFVETLIPAVLPPSLPITAWPPRLAARLHALRDAAADALRSGDLPGRVEIAPCRSVAALLRGAHPPDTLILVGRAPWSLRRAAHGISTELIAVPAPTSPRPRPSRIPVRQQAHPG